MVLSELDSSESDSVSVVSLSDDVDSSSLSSVECSFLVVFSGIHGINNKGTVP